MLGGDATCVKKLNDFDFNALNSEDFKYIFPSGDFGFASELFSVTNQIISSKSVSKRAKLKFAYNVSKNYRKSSSFKIQLGVILFGNYRIRSAKSFFYFLKHIIRIQTFLSMCTVIMGFLHMPEKLVDKLIGLNLKEYLVLSKVLSQIKPSFTLVLSSGYDNITYILSFIDKIILGKYIILINNWDNLSSKGFIGKKVNHVALWNHQQIHHATRISKVSTKKLTVIGSSTADYAYSKYSNIYNIMSQDKFRNKKLLYIGQQSKYDEIYDVIRIANLLKGGSTHYNSLTYRPHPFTMSKNKQLVAQKSKLIDIEVNTEKQINLLEFGAIITLPTTFLLEVIVSQVPAIIFLPSKQIFRKDPATMWNYTHFDPLKELSPIITVENFSKLENFIRIGFPQQQNLSSNLLNTLFPRFNTRYEERIEAMLTNVINDEIHNLG